MVGGSRKPRIRQEAGPSENTDKNEPESSTSNEDNWRKAGKPVQDRTSTNNETSAKPTNNFATSVHRRNDHHRGKSKSSRGRGKATQPYHVSVEIAPQFPSQAAQNSGTNVAIAEEKEFAPVMFMDSQPRDKQTVPDKEELETIADQYDIISNWQKFDAPIREHEFISGEDYLMGEDFSEVLKRNETTELDSHFKLKGEDAWGEADASYLNAFGFGELEISALATSLASIPFHVQMDIPEKSLPPSTVTYYSGLAESNKLHMPERDDSKQEINSRFLKTLLQDHSEEQLKPTPTSETVPNVKKYNFNIPEEKVPAPKYTKKLDVDIDLEEPLEEHTVPCVDELDAPIKVSHQPITIPKSEVEDLEDWLDAILDE